TFFPAALGFLFHLLTKKRTSEQEFLVFVVGLVFFASGAAFYFNLSPLYVSMVMGIVYSNLTRTHEKLYPLLLSTEKPLYIVLLILIGALWVFRFDWVIVTLVLAFIAARIIGYTVPLPIYRILLKFPFPLPPFFGLSFLSVGGIGVALAVSLKLAYPMAMTDIFLSVALLAAIVSEFLSPKALQMSIRNLDPEVKK
ncbi:MAG: cation:proton antiporter, partial [Candidatus Aminicenantes bacterium]|nr:cation:proton antiporter [Candidatus Aminicenantes bacterium]